MPATSPQDVLAAGVVVFRPGRRVLLVHRPKYDDWSFPKGKLDRGEHAVTAAVREVAEETGLHVRLCLPLASQRYPIAGGRSKLVSYWSGRVVGDDDVSGYVPNDEIGAVRWVEADEAESLLTYSRDVATLAEALRRRRKTRAVVVLRHAPARSRTAWRGDDRVRPLLVAGQHQAERLVPLLAAYDVTRVISSPSLRCVQTLEPFVTTTGWERDERHRLSEEDVTSKGLARIVDDVLDDVRGTVLCTHRPVLPGLFDALGLDDPGLALGEMLVVHLRKNTVVGTERHLPR
ncbi:MAG: NUDIX domain-containing protein [Nocardioides sp.]